MGLPIIGDVINAVKDIVSEVVVDKDKRDEVNLKLAQLQDQATARLDAQLQGQINVNIEEAKSASMFVAGWRPAIGWVGAASLLYAFILAPILSIFIDKVPTIQYDYLMTIITAMLGIGGMRTYEKVQGVSTDSIKKNPPQVELKEPPKKGWKKI